MGNYKITGSQRPAVKRITIIAALAKRDVGVSVWNLAKEFECSRKTVHRDLEFMRDQLEMPLVYQGETKTWHFDKAAKLPWFWL